jgi:hypothetical protein
VQQCQKAFTPDGMGAVLEKHKEKFGPISASLDIVGIMEYWNNGILRKVAILPILENHNEPIFIKLAVFRNPSFHYSIIPLFPFDYIRR